MKTRILTAVVGIPLVFVIMALYHTIFFNIIIAAICLLAMHEAVSAFKIKNGNWLFASFLPLTLALIFKEIAIIDLLLFPIAFLSIIAFVIFVIYNFKEINIANVSGSLLLSAITLLCFYSVISYKAILPFSEFSYDGVYIILLCLAYAWGGDSLAYFVGMRFGKTKLSPLISPNKTVEGAIGAVFGSMAFGLLITFGYSMIKPLLTGDVYAMPTVAFYLCIILLGVIASILGMAGDLFASAIKRQMQIKDYGTIFPGHGGILDRFDSVILITPFVTAILYIIRVFAI